MTNTEGEGDVSLVVKNEDERNNNAHLENMAAVIPMNVDGWLKYYLFTTMLKRVFRMIFSFTNKI